MKRLAQLCVFLISLSAGSALAGAPALNLTVDHGETLTLRAPASSVFIANPDIADVQVLSPTQVMIFGKRTGDTTFMATDAKGEVLAERTLVVSQDLAALRAELKSALPGNEIEAKPVPNGIILTGTARDAASVADAYKIAMRYMPAGGDIINRVQVTGSNQIQIRVRFAEVQRNIDNSLGFNWQSLLTGADDMVLGLASGNLVHGPGDGTFNINSATGLFPRPNNTSLSLPNSAIGYTQRFGDLTIQGMLDALAHEGLLTILAEPNLTAMSGETANFLAGGEFPIPIPQGNGTISISFRSYGISLAFTPTLLSGNRISLHVRPEVSELTSTGSIVSDNITIPALITRKAETTVEVASGESFAIAGLMNNSQTQSVNKFPGLGDLPILGALFRSDHFINGQTELVVIITPYIVKPSRTQLALPTDGFAPPTEAERIIGQRHTTANPNARPVSGDPVAVKTAPVLAVAPAPAAASVAPVAVTSPVEKKPEAKASSTTNVSLKPQKEEAKPAAKPAAAPIASAPAPTAKPAAVAPASMPVIEKPALVPSTSNLKLKSQVETTVAPAPVPSKPAAAKPALPAAKPAPAPSVDKVSSTPPPSTSNLVLASQPKAKAQTSVAKAPVSPKPPLVLRANSDMDKDSGGLLVE